MGLVRTVVRAARSSCDYTSQPGNAEDMNDRIMTDCCCTIKSSAEPLLPNAGGWRAANEQYDARTS